MEPTAQLREDTKRAWENLQRLRDEVRLKLHLAGMDARDEWDRIELLLPGMEKEMETTASEMSKVTREKLGGSIADLIRRLEKLRKGLDGG